jgi:hypothetical protein
MALNAVYVRATMPKSEWHPTFLMVDEFQEFVDKEKTPELLRFPREYNFGTMVAHHNMYAAELDQAIRVAISTNTGIKYCADPRGDDLNYMARDFNCEPDFLRRQQVSDTHVHFAHVMRRKYDTAVSVEIPRGNLARYQKRTKREMDEIDAMNVKLFHETPTVIHMSRDEWIDHHNSGYIDDTGRSLDPLWNVICKIDPTLQRWPAGEVSKASAIQSAPVVKPSVKPTQKPANDDWA